MNSQMNMEKHPKGHKMPAKGHKEVTGMHLKGMPGGVVSNTHHRTFRGGQGGGPDYDSGSDEQIHPSMDHLVSHLKKNMSHHFGNPMPESETDSMPEQGKRPADMRDSDVE